MPNDIPYDAPGRIAVDPAYVDQLHARAEAAEAERDQARTTADSVTASLKRAIGCGIQARAELADATMDIKGYAAERDRLTAELAAMTKIAQGNKRHVTDLTTIVDAIEKILQHPDASLRERLQQIEDTLNGAVAGGLGSSRRAQEPPMRAGQLARMFHETYEELAPLYGYRTREASAKPWDDVPRPNRELMIAIVSEYVHELERRLLAAGGSLERWPVDDEVRGQHLPQVLAHLRTLAEVRGQHGPGPGLPQVLAERLAQADAQDPAPTTAGSPLVVAAVARALREHAGRRADEIRHLAETLDGAELGAALGDLMADHWDELATEALAAARLHMAAGATFLDRR